MSATATILPNGRKRYLGASGAPLVGGQAYFYTPGTTTLKQTWQDSGQVTANQNPVVLDAAGSCVVYGSGVYREYVLDALGNLISDSVTSDTGIVSSAMKPVVTAATTTAALVMLGGNANFANIAALRANAVQQPSLIGIGGYYTPADGGAGAFWLDASDTLSADNGGTVIVDAAGNRWKRETGGLPYSVAWFGAKADGTDCTTQVTACLNAATALGKPAYLPAGHWVVSTLPTYTSLTLLGDGMLNSFLQTNTTTGNVVTVSGGWGEFHGITFTATTQRTSSAMIVWSSQGIIDNCGFDKYAVGVNAIGNTGTIKDCVFSNPTPSTGIGIIVNGYAGGLNLDGLFFLVPPSGSPLAGVNIVNAGAVQIANCDIISQGENLIINPGNGQTVGAVYATNTFFDTAQINGALISPVSGTNGSVTRCHFSGCWFSSANSNGVSIGNPGTGTVSGISFTNCTMIENLANGIAVGSGVTDISISGGQYAANAQNGIQFSGTVGFKVVGATAGSDSGVAGNGFYGISTGGAANDYIISLNRTAGNTTGAIQDAASGTTKYVSNNF